MSKKGLERVLLAVTITVLSITIRKVCRSKKSAERDFKYLAGDEDHIIPKSYSIAIIVLRYRGFYYF